MKEFGREVVWGLPMGRLRGERERSCSFPQLLSVCVQSVTYKAVSSTPDSTTRSQTNPIMAFDRHALFPCLGKKSTKSNHCRTGTRTVHGGLYSYTSSLILDGYRSLLVDYSSRVPYSTVPVN